MAIKATNGKIIENALPIRKVKTVKVDDGFSGDVAEGHPDEMIMVLFPRIAYDEFMKLAQEYAAGSVAETMSYALKLLRATLDKQKKEKG